MADTDVITTIIQMTQQFMTYMLPIIGVLAGITLILTFLLSVTLGIGRRTFKG